MFVRYRLGRAVGAGVGLSRSASRVGARMEGEVGPLLERGLMAGESFLQLSASLSQRKSFPVTTVSTLH